MIGALLLDWGDTVMRNFSYPGPMCDWPRVEAMPGAPAALEALRGRYRLVLATNAADSGAELVHAALQRAGLDRSFDAVFTARELGACKPEPAFYRAVLRELGCAPAEAAMVGDGYTVDVEGAKAVGLRAIWYNPSRALCLSGEPLCDAEVQALADLPAAVDGPFLPDVQECLALLAAHDASLQLIAHTRAVARAAYRLAARLRSVGEPVDPLLAHRGGLLHDLDKVVSRRQGRVHGQLAAEFLSAMGQPCLANIAERHLVYTILDPSARPASWEEKLVFYADKVVEGDQVATLGERLAALSERYPENAERMRRCLPLIRDLEAEIGTRMGAAPLDVLGCTETGGAD